MKYSWLRVLRSATSVVAATALSATLALAAGTEEAGTDSTTTMMVGRGEIADNGGKNAWNLHEWEAFIGRSLTFSEAPELAAMVAAGSLPPVEQRLPSNPLVQLPLSQEKFIGTYDDVGFIQICVVCDGQSSGRGAEHSGSANIYARVFESVTPSDGGRTWTFKLREGTKWSDGVPYTTEDVRFWYDDLVLYEPFHELWGGVGEGGQFATNPATLNVIDDYTYSLTYGEPNIGDLGLLQEGVATFHPKHYLSQFHPNHNTPAQMDAMVRESGFATILEFFDDKRDWYGLFHRNPDRPTLGPWELTVGAPSETPIFTRNPYYVGVDAEGQQLPYFNEIHFDGSESSRNVSVQKLRALNGDYDFVKFLSLDIFPAAKQAEIEEGEIKVATWNQVHLVGGGQQIEFNQNTNNEDLRAIFAERDFRCGISHAINRELIEKLNYYGMGVAGAISYSPGHPYYNPNQDGECGEYDLNTANRLLDRAGLSRRNADDIRLLPNGQPFEFTFTWRVQYDSENDAEMVLDMLKDVGINANLRSVDGWGALQSVRNNGEMHAYFGPMWATYATGGFASLGGFSGNQGYFAPAWGAWQASGGEEGEEPPPDVKEAIRLGALVMTQVELADRQETMRQMTDLATKNLWSVGIVTGTQTVIYGSNIHNVPTHDNLIWHAGDEGRPAVWFRNQ
jgi:peptide/nickel transport system substrate-binding protein